MSLPKPKRLSQDEMILMHLQSGEPITAAQAVAEYGCYRLASVINRLRKEHSIYSHTETATNRFGVKVKFARYRMATTPQKQPIAPPVCAWCHNDHPPGACAK